MSLKDSVVKVDPGMDLYIHFNGENGIFIGVTTRDELLNSTSVPPENIALADEHGTSLPEEEGAWDGHWKDKSGIHLAPFSDPTADLLVLRRRDFLPFALHIGMGDKKSAEILLGRYEAREMIGGPSLVLRLLQNAGVTQGLLVLASKIMSTCAGEFAKTIEAHIGPNADDIQTAEQTVEILRRFERLFEDI